MSRLLLNHDMKLSIVANMRQYGGSFVQALAGCIIAADKHNLAKIEETFGNYVLEYHPNNWGGSPNYHSNQPETIVVKGKHGQKKS